MHKNPAFLLFVVIITSLNLSCNKEKGSYSSGSGTKHLINITIEGKTYSYAYDTSGCTINTSYCALSSGQGYSEYRNSRLTRNQIIYETGLLGGLTFTIEENCSLNCMFGILYLEEWQTGTYRNAQLIFMTKKNSYSSDADGSRTPLLQSVTITQSGPAGSLVKGTFSGNVYKNESNGNYSIVPVSGEFSAPRIN